MKSATFSRYAGRHVASPIELTSRRIRSRGTPTEAKNSMSIEIISASTVGSGMPSASAPICQNCRMRPACGRS